MALGFGFGFGREARERVERERESERERERERGSQEVTSSSRSTISKYSGLYIRGEIKSESKKPRSTVRMYGPAGICTRPSISNPGISEAIIRCQKCHCQDVRACWHLHEGQNPRGALLPVYEALQDMSLLTWRFCTLQGCLGDRGTSRIRNRFLLGPYSMTMPRALRWSCGGLLFLMSEVPPYAPLGDA